MTILEETLLAMVVLLEKNGEAEWSRSLREMAFQIGAGRAEDVIDKVRRSFGGMGSLNDVVLQQGGIPSCDNDHFDSLRSELFNLVTVRVK